MSALNNNNGGITVDAGDFKVGAIEDGKRSVRSISGLRRDSEIMYVPKYDDANGKDANVYDRLGMSFIQFSLTDPQVNDPS